MKDLLKEYYGLKIEYSREYQQGLIFFVNGDYYYLCKTYLTVDDIKTCMDLTKNKYPEYISNPFP